MNNNQFESFLKPIPSYIVNNFVQQMMTQDTLNEYFSYINQCNFLLNQINTYEQNSLWIENNYLYFNLNGKSIDCDLNNYNDIEIGLSNHFKQDIQIIQNVEELVPNKRNHPHIVYIPIFLIPTINYNIIYFFDIYDNRRSYIDRNNHYFNLFTYTPFLTKRLDVIRKDQYALDRINSSILSKAPLDSKLAKEYFINRFLQSFTVNRNFDYIEEWIKYFFKTLRRVPEALVLIANKNISEDIFFNKIIKPIFEPIGANYCITLTDIMLENKSIADIVANKLFIHINHIPENEIHKKKLKELLIDVFTHKTIYNDNNTIPIYAQILFTLDNPHPFLNDFLSASKVFFVDSLNNITNALDQQDEISIHKNIYENMEYFATQLSSLENNIFNSHYIDEPTKQTVLEDRVGNSSSNIVLNDTISFKEKDYITDNELFKNWLKDPELMELALSKNGENPILDPFGNSFEKILPTEERYKHTYVTGKTGSGKSELLKTLIYRDILRDDCSVILLDIHGDLADSVTRLVKDKERLVLIDPILEKDLSPTINLFHTDDKAEENIEQVSQMITTIINEINIGDNPSGSMIDILENCIPLLVRSNNKDFYDLKRLMKDVPKVTGTKDEKEAIQRKRNRIQSEIDRFSKNEFEEEYFQDEFMDINNSTRQAVKRRLNKMLKDSLFSNLTNGQNTINLRKEMNSAKNKVIIFNIPKSKMLNTHKHYIKFIIGLIQIIALKRADIKDEKKRPHTHLYIDEFHNFITPTIEEILTESRKYKLFLTLAHQSISQIKDGNLRDIILDNTNVKIVGKNSNKTLDMMNKTLNTKLEDVSKLTTGEFNLQSGTNDVIKIRNSDKLLDGKERISDVQWEDHKHYQIEKYYRSTKKEDIEENQTKREEDEFNENLEKFIALIKQGDPEKSSIADNLKSEDYEELKYNFEDLDEEGCFYIARPKMLTYFEALYGKTDFEDNASFLEKLKEKDRLFEQKVDNNTTYKSKKRYKICQ